MGRRILNSAWLVIALVGFGCVSAGPMIVLGVMARRRSWWISGIVYTVLAWAAFVVDGTTAGTRDAAGHSASTAAGNAAIAVLITVWLVTIIHSAAIVAPWLRWRTDRAALRSPVGPL
jgi:hypothetical protein